MGVSVSVYGILGVRIPDRDRLYSSRRTRGCSHALPYYGAGKFCPTCGKPVWEGEDVPVDGYDDGRETGSEPTLGGLDVLSTSSENQSREAFVCSLQLQLGDPMYGGWVSGLAADRAELADVAGAAKELRELLEPLGLWDEKEFGFWVVATAG